MSRWPKTLAVMLLTLVPLCAVAEAHRQARPQMGTMVEIVVWSDDAGAADKAIQAAFNEIDRLEKLLSEWIPGSQISNINKHGAARPVAVGAEVLTVLQHGLEIGKASTGAFDVSWAAMRGLWKFDKDTPRLPDKAAVAAAAALVDHRLITVNEAARTVRLGKRGMAIGLGAIAKGYAVDRAAALLHARGFKDVLVNGGGDVMARGSKAGTPWRIGVQHPRAKHGELLAVVALKDESLVTSGDYERFMVIDGQRYHHILNPRTGMPARGAMSVSVIAPTAMDADALSTAAFVMGPKDGLAFLEKRPGVEGLIVDSAGKIHMTSGAAKRISLRVQEVSP